MLTLFKKKTILETPDAVLPVQPSMRNANAKMIRFWHFHTDKSRAGPTRVQKYTASRESKILRLTVPNPPPPYTISPLWKATKPEVASGTLRTAQELEQFLYTCYRTKSGFTYKKGSLSLLQELSRTSTLALLLRNPEGHICGCVLSLEQKGLFGFYGEKTQPVPRRIQYVCIHPMLRGRGLAGWMLGWLDTLSHQTYGPCVHMGWWFAPPPRIWSPLPSIVQTKLYKKVVSEKRRDYEYTGLERVSTAAAKRVLDELLAEPVTDWLGPSHGSYLGLYSIPADQEVVWWKYTDEDLHGCSILVGLAPTQMEAREGPVWQIVFCSFVRSRPGNVNDISMPFWENSPTYKHGPRKVIELALEAEGVRVAIVSDIPSHYGGGAAPSNWTGWTRMQERSKLILYNWMPPTFAVDDCLWIGATI